MFSGIVEETAKLVKIEKEQSNIHFYFTCSFGDQLRIDQSVAHNGVCLTVRNRQTNKDLQGYGNEGNT